MATSIAGIIETVAQQAGITQNELARQSGVDPSVIGGHVEKLVTARILREVAGALSLDPRFPGIAEAVAAAGSDGQDLYRIILR